MEEQRKKLEAHFKRFLIKGDEDPEEYGDEFILGECWTWKEPERVECWSVVLSPASSHLSFITKWQNCGEMFSVSLYETITKVKTRPDN